MRNKRWAVCSSVFHAVFSALINACAPLRNRPSALIPVLKNSPADHNFVLDNYIGKRYYTITFNDISCNVILIAEMIEMPESSERAL